MLSQRLFGSLLLASTLLFAACDQGDDSYQPPPPPPQQFTCTATVSPTVLAYIRTGDVLQVSAGGQTEGWSLVSGGGDLPAYGTWHVSDSVGAAGTVSLDVIVAPGQITAVADCDFGTVSATARATSAAEITDSSISILETQKDVQVVTK
jgi:hypothetical protein